jgi:cytochrome P450/NADPH-cytochrome P450 reductase
MRSREPTANFHLPEDPSVPIIMIGPGTGIAPFRGFLQQRDHLQQNGALLGDAMLFFGCRHPDRDYLYRNELEDYGRRGVAAVHAAFSRHEGSRTYVQDLITQQGDQIWSLIERGARIFICGGAHMEPDVRKALTAITSEDRRQQNDAAG